MASSAGMLLAEQWARRSSWSRRQPWIWRIYAYLKARGGIEQDEYIVLGGWPVQFLPPSNDLELEAIEKSVATVLEGVNTSIMTAEQLAAIALRTGRAKDHNRVLQFVEQNAVNRTKLRSILQRHGLTSKWKQFEHKYLAGHP